MSKRRKGYEEYTKYKRRHDNQKETIDSSIDFHYFAKEYSKLLNKRYQTVLNNGQKIDFFFNEGNFYHLLGFHKFDKTIFHYMINEPSIKYSQADFYNDVLDGNISYESFKQEKINKISEVNNPDDFIIFSEHEHTEEIRQVLHGRFQYFSFERIIEVLKSKVVIDFDKEYSFSNVRANKIFFKFIDEVQKNLNLFLDNEDANYFTTSFFLENSKNKFRKKTNGEDMETLDVLFLYIEDSESYKPFDFWINWEIVTNYVVNRYNISVYKNLKKYFTYKEITKHNINHEIEIAKYQLCKLLEKNKGFEKDLEINKLKKEYIDNPKDEYILCLMEYNVDIDKEELNNNMLEKECTTLKRKIKDGRNKIKNCEKKLRIMESSLLEISKMDILKIKSVYCPLLINGSFWEDDFWLYILNKFDCFVNIVNPSEIRNTYKIWKSNKTILK